MRNQSRQLDVFLIALTNPQGPIEWALAESSCKRGPIAADADNRVRFQVQAGRQVKPSPFHHILAIFPFSDRPRFARNGNLLPSLPLQLKPEVTNSESEFIRKQKKQLLPC